MDSLKDFCQAHPGPLEDGHRLPFKLVEDAITLDELEGFATADVISGRIRGVQSYTSFGARSIAESDAGLIVNLAARTEHDDEVCFTQHALLLRFLCICEDDNDE